MEKQNTSTVVPDSEQKYDEFLTQCLELQEKKAQQKERKKSRVAIVGAGMAGLTAAWVLQLYGHEVIVFEASNRVGGRVRTLRENFTPGLYVEAGAMRVPDSHVLTVALINGFGLKKMEFLNDVEKPWVFRKGKWMTMGKYLASPHCGSKLFEACIKPLRDLLDNKKYSSMQSAEKRECDRQRDLLTKISLGEYLRYFMRTEEKILNPVTGDTIDPGYLDGEKFDLIFLDESRAFMDASIREVLRENETFKNSIKYQIRGGMDLLPKAFCDQKFITTDSIFFNARVRLIDLKGTNFTVTYENTTTHEELQEPGFNRVILAAPFSSLCHVKIPIFEDESGYHKQAAIRSLHYENATKIALEFSEQFWRNDGIVGGRSITDLPVRWVHYPTHDQYKGSQYEGRRGILLASYTLGEDSLRWSALDKDTRVRYAYANIKDLHKNAFTSNTCRDPQLVAGMSYSWAEDSYSLGAFAIFRPHQEEFFKEIWKEHRGIHFAGEHTSLKHAWIEGAVESGLRAAQEVDTALP